MDYLDYQEQIRKELAAMKYVKRADREKRVPSFKGCSRSVKGGYTQPIGTRGVMW